MSLTPFSGNWNLRTAAHLLRRTTFGPNKDEIKSAVALGLNATMDKLFEASPTADPPLNYRDTIDTVAPIGQTWVNAPHTGENLTTGARFNSFVAWIMKSNYERRFNIEQKMLTFWHNHIPCDFATVRDSRYLYKYWETFRRNLVGNFQTLIEEITIDPATLRYLDGRTNTKAKPNENFAREVLELFTIGKGPISGPGDYTHYTEDDVLAIAKVMTGWRDVGYNNRMNGDISSRFILNNHNTDDKTLSHRFNNVVISNGGDSEYKTLLGIVFQQDEVARFICRKLYRYFVATEIDDQVEIDIIEPMASMVRNDNYELKNALIALLKSEHFFEQLEVVGGIISNPVEFVFDFFTVGTSVDNAAFEVQYAFWNSVHRLMDRMQMSYMAVPDVAGWKAYYLEPQYSELWINSVTLGNRLQFIRSLISLNGYRISRDIPERVTLNLLNYVDGLVNPENADSMIGELADSYYPNGLSDDQKDELKGILLSGDSDNVWTSEYEAYQKDPSDPNLSLPLNERLVDLFTNLYILPEFQVI